MADFLSWITDPDNNGCAEGIVLAEKCVEDGSGARGYWEGLDNPEMYLYGVVNRAPEVATRAIVRCIERILHQEDLPDVLAGARAVALDQNATQDALKAQFEALGGEKLTFHVDKEHQDYYRVIWNLLRWRLGLTRPMVLIKILNRILKVMFRFEYPVDPHTHVLLFLRKEIPFEEWLGTYSDE